MDMETMRQLEAFLEPAPHVVKVIVAVVVQAWLWLSDLGGGGYFGGWLARVIFALAILFVSGVLFWVFYMASSSNRRTKDMIKLDFEARRCVQLFAMVAGYFTLACTPNAEGDSYSLSMGLRTIAEKDILMYIFAILYIPIILATLFWFVLYLVKFHGGLDVVFDHLHYIARGMLISQGFELFGWLIGQKWYTDGGMLSGSLPYFLFFALLIAQIILLAGMVLMSLLHFLHLFGLDGAVVAIFDSFSGSSSYATPSSDSASASPFSQFITGPGGDSYRLERENGERATYYNPKTGNRISVHRDDVDT